MGLGARNEAAGRWTVVGALALLAFVVVLSALTGPVVRSGSSAPGRTPNLSQPSPTGPVTSTAREPASRPPAPHKSFGFWLAAWVLVLPAVAAVVVLMVLRGQVRHRDDPVPVAPPGAAPGPAPAPPTDMVTAVDEGLALLATATPSEVGDAVITCWVRLEQAAAASGLPRRAAATPTEFTADLLVAGIGEEAAVRELLGLYQAARFGSRPLPADAAARAISCLAAIRTSAQARTAAR